MFIKNEMYGIVKLSTHKHILLSSFNRYIKKAHGDASLAQVAKSRENALLKLKNSEDLIAPPPRDRKFRFR